MEWWDGAGVQADHEVWAWVNDAQDRYAVSSLGRVMSWARKVSRVLEPTMMASGYLTVGLYYVAGKPPTTRLVHQLVLEAFRIAKEDNQTDVRHLNGKKNDNRLCNLAWGTRSENMRDVLVHRQQPQEERIWAANAEGKWYGGRTWDVELVELLLMMEAENRLMVVDVARILAVSEDVVQNILRGRGQSHIRTPERTSQVRRSKVQKAAILALVAEGKNTQEINTALGETLTAQAVNYYKQQLRLKSSCL